MTTSFRLIVSFWVKFTVRYKVKIRLESEMRFRVSICVRGK